MESEFSDRDNKEDNLHQTTPDIITDKKAKITTNLKENFLDFYKNNKVFVYILIFAIIIRLYYFFLTINQPLWWDEACYGALARNLASHLWDNTTIIQGETLIRPILLPFFWSILMKLNISETGVRFLLEFLPSVLSVFLPRLHAGFSGRARSDHLFLDLFTAVDFSAGAAGPEPDDRRFDPVQPDHHPPFSDLLPIYFRLFHAQFRAPGRRLRISAVRQCPAADHHPAENRRQQRPGTGPTQLASLQYQPANRIFARM